MNIEKFAENISFEKSVELIDELLRHEKTLKQRSARNILRIIPVAVMILLAIGSAHISGILNRGDGGEQMPYGSALGAVASDGRASAAPVTTRAAPAVQDQQAAGGGRYRPVWQFPESYDMPEEEMTRYYFPSWAFSLAIPAALEGEFQITAMRVTRGSFPVNFYPEGIMIERKAASGGAGYVTGPALMMRRWRSQFPIDQHPYFPSNIILGYADGYTYSVNVWGDGLFEPYAYGVVLNSFRPIEFDDTVGEFCFCEQPSLGRFMQCEQIVPPGYWEDKLTLRAIQTQTRELISEQEREQERARRIAEQRVRFGLD